MRGEKEVMITLLSVDILKQSMVSLDKDRQIKTSRSIKMRELKVKRECTPQALHTFCCGISLLGERKRSGSYIHWYCPLIFSY